MKRLFLSITSIILSVCLLFSAMPILASAAEEPYAEQFEFTVRVTDDNKFRLPTYGDGLNNNSWHIDWGDGSSDDISDITKGTDITHTYASSGDYPITITPKDSTEAWLSRFGGGGNIRDYVSAEREKIIVVKGFITPLMTRTQAQIEETNIDNLPNGEWANTFYGCTNLTMSDDFNFAHWEKVKAVGNEFANGMFSSCRGNGFTMNDDFNLPQNITTVGDHFAMYMFSDCIGESFTMGKAFNLPQNITTVGDSFAEYMFSTSHGENFTMNEVFNLPPNIHTVGDKFAEDLFIYCFGDNFTMNKVFNMPQNITTAGNDFAHRMFSGCSGASFSMNEVFSLPSNIISVGNRFAKKMFSFCSGDNFTMGKSFNLPQNIKTAGDNFAHDTFFYCEGDNFTMNEIFNLPQDIISAGNYFACGMFVECTGADFTMNEVFNLPQNIETVGDDFAETIFAYCSGDSFTMNEVFNLPQNIKSSESYFARSMFEGCEGSGFLVNDIFTFPVLDTEGNYHGTFYNVTNPQYRSATSIIGENATPADNLVTLLFASGFKDQEYVHENWSGGGEEPTPEEPYAGLRCESEYTVPQNKELELRVFGQSYDLGELSYQWYSNDEDNNTDGTPIEGATNSTYTPPTDEVGTTYYYCVVTSTNSDLLGQGFDPTTRASDLIKVEVDKPESKINKNPASNPVSSGYTVTYDLDGKGEVVNGETNETVKAGETPTSTPDVRGLDRYIFSHWELDGKKVNPLETEISGDTDFKAIYVRGFIHGYVDKSFKPEGKITRAEFLKMAVYANPKDYLPTVSYGNTFPDIGNEWYANVVGYAQQQKYVVGDDKGMFNPYDEITREEAAIILCKVYEIEIDEDAVVTNFNDSDKISSWAMPYMAALVNDKIYEGYGDNTVRPQGKITRAEAATLTSKLDGFTPTDEREKEIKETIDSLFTDIEKNWAYAYVLYGAGLIDE